MWIDYERRGNLIPDRAVHIGLGAGQFLGEHGHLAAGIDLEAGFEFRRLGGNDLEISGALDVGRGLDDDSLWGRTLNYRGDVAVLKVDRGPGVGVTGIAGHVGTGIYGDDGIVRSAPFRFDSARPYQVLTPSPGKFQ